MIFKHPAFVPDRRRCSTGLAADRRLALVDALLFTLFSVVTNLTIKGLFNALNYGST
jgi:hypothetical protein